MLTAVEAFLIGLTVAAATTPAGVSGAVLLLPVQVSVLEVPSPAVTPTNLLYNVVATPGALCRYWQLGQLRGSLPARLIAGTLPGVVIGAILRVEVLSGPETFLLVVAAVLAPLGVFLLLSDGTTRRKIHLAPATIVTLAFIVGMVGGIYGMGGGSILAPILLAAGYAAYDVAPAALASTFVTSIAGIVAFLLLATTHSGSVAPDWTTGIPWWAASPAQTSAPTAHRLPNSGCVACWGSWCSRSRSDTRRVHRIGGGVGCRIVSVAAF